MSFVEVVRGGVVESRHAVQMAVCDAEGVMVASSGETSSQTFYRSAAKPLQALPLVEEGIAERLGLTAAELALCCASHEGEPQHVAGARAILEKAKVHEDFLACGPHPPFSETAARKIFAGDGEPLPIHNNCSGKHAGMLALAVGMGWDPVGYHLPDHPVQRRMLAEIVRWSGVEEDEVGLGVDGCGVTCFAVSLEAMAGSFARFAAAAREGHSAASVVQAMTAHPFMVGGTGRTCTDVMDRVSGRVFVKLGAEGVYAGGIPDRGLGFAIKVIDGGRRAVEVALVWLLHEIGALSDTEAGQLSAHGRPSIHNTRGELVGEIRPDLCLALHSQGL